MARHAAPKPAYYPRHAAPISLRRLKAYSDRDSGAHTVSITRPDGTEEHFETFSAYDAHRAYLAAVNDPDVRYADMYYPINGLHSDSDQ